MFMLKSPTVLVCMVLYNPMGVIHIDRCHLIGNRMPDMQALIIPGGGGLVIEANTVTSQSFCTISNSIFTNNSASSGQYWFLSPSTNPIEYFGLGRGGGGGAFILFLNTKIKCPFNITVVIKMSNFISNTANNAACDLAFYVMSDLHNNSFASNRLLIENCLFDSNLGSARSSIHIYQMGNSQQPLLNTILCCSNFTNTHYLDWSSSILIII